MNSKWIDESIKVLKFADDHIDNKNISIFLREAIIAVEKVAKDHKGLRGEAKKDMALKLLIHITDKLPISSEHKSFVKTFIDSTAPLLIDLIITAHNKKLFSKTSTLSWGSRGPTGCCFPRGKYTFRE
jgi:hypothetical protein